MLYFDLLRHGKWAHGLDVDIQIIYSNLDHIWPGLFNYGPFLLVIN